MTEKSILEQALLQVQTLEEAVKQNAKGILASTMKEELNELLKESEEEVDTDEVKEGDVEPEMAEMSGEPKEKENDMSEQPEDDETGDEEESGDEVGSDENMDDLDNEDPMKGIDSMDSEDDMDSEDEMSTEDEFGMDDDMSSDDDVMDMTGASDEEVLKVFKAMKPEDGIVVKKDGDDVSLDLDGDEYIIKLGEEDESEFAEEEEKIDAEEETIYEIELDEEDETTEEEEETKEVEATEASRTYANDVRVPANKGKKYKAGRKEINEEVENLKKQNSEYKKALVLFKEKLNEVAVFNANLAYATRLFTEHSTTKQEKLNILKRFDSVSTMNEAKNLFNTIKSELGTKKPVTESVVEKISSTPQTSTSQQVLSESKAYENPQFKRMKDLMGKIK
jgi:hypothetical protein